MHWKKVSEPESVVIKSENAAADPDQEEDPEWNVNLDDALEDILPDNLEELNAEVNQEKGDDDDEKQGQEPAVAPSEGLIRGKKRLSITVDIG